jgi:hypothetical protein
MNDEFNLERAIAGDPIETVAGTQVEFIAYRPTAEACKQLIIQVGTDILMYRANGRYPSQTTNCYFDLRMKSAPAKQVDWSKIPVDTLLTLEFSAGKDDRYFSSFVDGRVRYYRDGMTSKTIMYKSDILDIHPRNVQIKNNQPWTVWLGGTCPLPDGIEFEYMTSNDSGRIMTSTESASSYSWSPNDIYAYRLTGSVLGGWTL